MSETLAEQWDRVKQLALAEIQTDLVDVWEMLRYLETTFLDQDDDWYQTMTLLLIAEIIKEESEIYFVTLENGEFHQWQTSPQQVVDHIDSEWKQLGRRPKGTEIGWLTLWPI